MKQLILSICLLHIFFLPCMAQIYFSLNSLESLIDAEQVAMGGSFVAYKSGLTSFKQNPATLTGINYSTAYYSYRDNEIHEFFKESDFSEFGIIIKSPIGVSNINYARFNWGESIYTNELGEYMGKISNYDYNISVNHGYQLTESLSLGVSLKWIDLNWKMTDVDPEEFNFDSEAAIIGDIGLTYQLNGLFSASNINDSLVLGASLQNFGSDLKFTPPFNIGAEEEIGYQMPRYFKIGFAYGLTVKSNNHLPVFEYLLTAQYGRWLNPDKGYEGNADLGGIGSKVRFWEVLELNIGGYYQAIYTFYANEDVLNIRYGFAINLPFQRLVWNSPITAKFSYTHLPINQYPYLFGNLEKQVSIITGQISYNVDLF